MQVKNRIGIQPRRLRGRDDVLQRVKRRAVAGGQGKRLLLRGRVQRLPVIGKRQDHGIEAPFLEGGEGGINLRFNLIAGIGSGGEIIHTGHQPCAAHLVRMGKIAGDFRHRLIRLFRLADIVRLRGRT